MLLTAPMIAAAPLALALIICTACLALFRLQPKFLKHVQLFQVLRAQTLLPYIVEQASVENEGDEDTVVVRPLFTNQLGNNLFQYSYARIYALCRGARFEAGEINQDPLVLDQGPWAESAPFDGIAQQTHQITFDAKNAQRFLRQRPNAFAQDMSLFRGFYGDIRAWLEPSVEAHVDGVAAALAKGVQRPDTVVLHLRFAAAHEGLLRADPTYTALDLAFYSQALRTHQASTGCPVLSVVVVHGPGCQDNVARFLAGLQAEWPGVAVRVQCESRCSDFLTMYCARHLILSVSTFAWWAAFLGHSQRTKLVYFPMHAPAPACSAARLRSWFNRLLPEGEDDRFVPVAYSTR